MTSEIRRALCRLAAAALAVSSLGLVVSATAGVAPDAHLGPVASGVMQQLDALDIPFEDNRGQYEARVAYAARTFAGTLFVTRDGKIVHALAGAPLAGAPQPAAPTASARSRGKRSAGKDAHAPGWALVETFERGARLQPAGGQPATTQVRRFIGNDPAQWRDSGRTYQTVRLGRPWPGITVDLAAHGRNVEKLFTVEPGADAGVIALKVGGTTGLRLGSDGALLVATGNGDVAFTAPVAYQDIGDSRIRVPVRYQLLAGNRYRFAVGDYDRGQPLVIDPLLQSTYVSGSSADGAYAMAIEPVSGSVYIAGLANSIDFPGVTGGAQPARSTINEAFVAKLSANLKTLVQATYLGGTGFDWAHALAVDGSGNVFVAGETTSADFPGVTGGARAVYSGASDVFVAKLSGDLKTLLQSTYLGGAHDDLARGIATDSAGNVYVAGYTTPNAIYVYDFPGTTGGALATVGPNSALAGFVSRLSNDLKTLTQSTLIAGSFDNASLITIAVTAAGSVFVGGQTYANDLPGVTGGAQSTFVGHPINGFVSRFSSDLKTLVQSTYIGGHQDAVTAIALAPGGDLYVTGFTDATTFPGAIGGAQPALSMAGAINTFVARLSGDLKTLVQSTYFGGNGGLDRARTIVIDANSHVFIAGTSNSNNLPGSTGGASPGFGLGTKAGFAARFATDLKSVVQSTYLESEAGDGPTAIAVDSGGNLYVAGSTTSHSVPGTSGGAQPSIVGSNFNAAFVTKFSADLSLSAGCILDLDGNGTIDALTDGLMLIRALFGLIDTSVTNGAIGPGATRTTWAQIQPVIHLTSLDIDGNGTTDALTDGLIILRAMFGLTGASVTNGAVGAGATRTTWAQIQPYLNSNCGTNFNP